MGTAVALTNVTQPIGKKDQNINQDIKSENIVLQWKTREQLQASRRKTGLNLGRLITSIGLVED